ncbi:flagellar hook-associated protein FlgK [Paracoccus sp. Z330]|uniref:Flagellar hook-associated protein 1 n=1 Tax=Paracoccus onchidii TaxID=3017813 RepID=A0ABT4ZHG8_9RHOB|nr:flagellar hook-associated protein FlgK [Paracoccus onchidii]MDB6178807.1 flagellar hook-associated protein FlgK [Paracoccus onchidii]
MSIAGALNNALSGLTATAKGTETVASNLANVMTPGYARRELSVTSQPLGGGMGGVRIEGVTRMVNTSLVSEARLAGSSKSEMAILSDFFSDIGAVIGMPGEDSALGAALTGFHSALQAAISRPDDELRLVEVVDSATRLAGRLNDASDQVQVARSTADAEIARNVVELNSSLETVALLNRKIARAQAEGADASGLLDHRQGVIDSLSKIVPVQEIPRENGSVALFTAGGAQLLDGSKPVEIKYHAIGQVTADMNVGTPPVGRLIINGHELTQDRMALFSGGALSANFAIRDEHAPQIQAELDALAFDLHQRVSAPTTDATLAPGDPGLFTDAGQRADAVSLVGFSSRIEVNALVAPENGEVWRMRSGLGATNAGPVGDSSLLSSIVDSLSVSLLPDAQSPFWGSGRLQDRFADLEARVTTRRVTAETELSMTTSRWEVVSGALMSEGVDSDAEMQRLLQYEQAYAANARVVQAIEEMMDQILRI